MPPRKDKSISAPTSNVANGVASIKYPAKRKNIPPAGLEAQGVIREAPKIRYEYNPHLPPALRSAKDVMAADKLPELLTIARQRALSAEEAKLLADALRRHEPWLEWSGKREKPWFEVDPVALHMHERISTQAILRVLAREDVDRDLFADPQLDYAKAVQFYQHDVDWANRMILGDSLQVMASLARREDYAGKVQTIYHDPPYGIKFGSNFQPQLGQRDVKDREQDLTREPEMVKAYRDTWTLGIHSYLAYLRDRLAMARELLADSGSIFVQISDENLHLVRSLMDEIFGQDNSVAVIAFKKTGYQAVKLLPSNYDYLLFYAKNIKQIKYRQLYIPKLESSAFIGQDLWCDDESKLRRRLSSEEVEQLEKTAERVSVFRHKLAEGAGGSGNVEPFEWEGRLFRPKDGKHFSTTPEGMKRLSRANRLIGFGKSLRFVNFLGDHSVTPVTTTWPDTVVSGFSDPQLYVVQTATKAVERCLLMTTDPGDLVFDPTCGGGTTAYVTFSAACPHELYWLERRALHLLDEKRQRAAHGGHSLSLP
jgi:adenine-specific DNA-methyltransferase